MDCVRLIFLSISIFGVRFTEAISCNKIESIPNGDIFASQSSPYSVGTVLTFECDHDFKGIGPRTITCLGDGRWSDTVPYCKANVCKRDVSKLDAGRKCKKSCQSDSNCKGTFKKCLCDDWCGKSCFNPDASCYKPTIPTNGYVIGTKFTYGYTVTYGCNEGYSMVGDERRRCLSNRKWSGIEPKCEAYNICGLKPDDKSDLGKVIHGEDSKPGEWPWQALLFKNVGHFVRRIYDENSTLGGGSVIDDKWILTAAHNFDRFDYSLKTNKYWETEFLLSLGMTNHPNSGKPIPDYVNIFEPSKVYRHPKYNSNNYDYDVALLRIGKRLKVDGERFVVESDAADGLITFSRYIRPICLPCMKKYPLDVKDLWKNFDKTACPLQNSGISKSSGLVNEGDYMWVTGFGFKRNPGESNQFLPRTLQKGLLKILKDDRCAKSVKDNCKEPCYSPLRFSKRMFCAASANKSLFIDSCQGDSGGSLVKQLDSKDSNYWVALGIVSWGYECGSNDPGFYTLLPDPSVISWVVNTVGSVDQSSPGPSNTCVAGHISGRVKISKGNELLKTTDKVLMGETLSLECMDPNTAVLGETMITCEGGNEWSRSPKVLCGPVRLICKLDALPEVFDVHQENGELVELVPLNIWTGKSLQFRCQLGDIGRSSTVACVNGQWIPGIPTSCGDKKCPILVGIENGYVDAAGTSRGYSAKYVCNTGYILSGADTRVCLSTGKWSGYEPKCLAFSVCGQSGSKRGRSLGKVVNGFDAEVGRWPWQAVIYDEERTASGGSIINDKWILTAASSSSPTNRGTRIFVGLTRLHPVPDSANIFEQKEIHVHPKYDDSTFDYDVALIRVGKRLKQDGDEFVVDSNAPHDRIIFSQYIRPVCLPCVEGNPQNVVDIWKNFDKTCDKSRAGTPGGQTVVTGFGDTDGSYMISNKLQEAIVEKLDDRACIETRNKIVVLNNGLTRYTSRMLCAFGTNETARAEACAGDGGGPLVTQVTTGNREYWIQIGIVSWGFECGVYPGFYTSVASVMPWISSVVDKPATIALKCKKPTSPRNGRIVSAPGENRMVSGDYQSGSQIWIVCDEGYTVKGKASSLCGPEGKWTSVLECIVKSCSSLPQLENGIAIGGKYIVGSVLEFRCNSGYKLVGNPTTKCQTDGQWGQYPVCEAMSCPDVVTPDNGKVIISPSGTSKPYRVGTRITFTCDAYYKREGIRTIRCLQGGRWSGSSPICKETGCLLFAIELGSNAYVKNFEDQDVLAEPGSTYTLRCKNIRSKKSNIVCRGKDIWEPSYYDFVC